MFSTMFLSPELSCRAARDKVCLVLLAGDVLLWKWLWFLLQQNVLCVLNRMVSQVKLIAGRLVVRVF